jgi:tight adherence protein B
MVVAVVTLVLLIAAAGRRALAARRRRMLTRRLVAPTQQAVLQVAANAAARIGRRRRDAKRVERDLPLAMEEIARGLRTGASLRQAIAEAAAVSKGAVGNDLGHVVAHVDHGAPLAIAVEWWVEHRPLPGVRLAAAALALGAETGGAQARAVDGVAATLRERLAAAAEVRAQATQARVSAAVIALAPIAFCALATATDPRTATFLFRTPAGLVLLAGGLGLDALGALWMNRLTRVQL